MVKDASLLPLLFLTAGMHPYNRDLTQPPEVYGLSASFPSLEI